MFYHAISQPNGEQRELDPYALVHRSGWWYVIGFCHLRQGMRYFRVDRIAEVTLTGQTFTAPASFDVHAYLAQVWQEVPQITVRMRFAPQFTHLAKVGRGYWDMLEEQPDGAAVVTFKAPDLNAAASNALSYGPAVTVLEPPEVCRLVREWALAAADLYKH
jgi:predicted DNA-binding transcriptional regulator YafY